jgi:guanylate kinase
VLPTAAAPTKESDPRDLTSSEELFTGNPVHTSESDISMLSSHDSKIVLKDDIHSFETLRSQHDKFVILFLSGIKRKVSRLV